ncbi:MAG TPA: TonB-dependent receptor plug domain-containing protein, partial [Mycobacterium sp.]|nr:TonB-dependent receptor plug domain-containing protein [Mycobacterium sp.]
GFTVPSLLPGTYTVTISLQGFKTVALSNVVMNAGINNAVKAQLAVGALEETVTVQAQTEIVQTQSAAVAQTLNVQQISTLPLTSRSVMDFIQNLPGVNTASGVRNGNISGLPQSAVNITLDGMNIQDNFLKSSDGMFALVGPRIDAVEEVTVSSAASSAESIGQGAVQIRFTTRSGSNQWRGSAYMYYRDQHLNANSWFNNRDHVDKPLLMQRQPGARLGGPIIKDKLFFFVNYEEFRAPSTVTRNRTILSPGAMAGNYLYKDADGNVQSVSLLDFVDPSTGEHFTSTLDPTVAGMMQQIRAATGTTGSVIDQSNPLYQRYTFNVAVNSVNRYPTTRVDYNITS